MCPSSSLSSSSSSLAAALGGGARVGLRAGFSQALLESVKPYRDTVGGGGG
jgi:hypothetical protein